MEFSLIIDYLQQYSIMHSHFYKISDKTSIDTKKLLGKGSTGNVFEGITITEQGPRPVAIKTIQLKTIDNEVTQYLLKCQLEALKCLTKSNNRYIVKLQEIIILQDVCYIVMEKLNGGTLREFINANPKPKGISQSCSFEIGRKIIEGYKGLHNYGIIHRDLKPQNIIFRNKNYEEPCIIDFGYCIVANITNTPKMYYNVGSPRYMSPEAYKNNKYSEKSDIWAIGIMIYELIGGNTMDQGQKIPQYHQKIAKQGILYPKQFANDTKNFLNLLLAYDINQRIGFIDLVKEITRFNLFRSSNAYRGGQQNVLKTRQIKYQYVNSNQGNTLHKQVNKTQKTIQRNKQQILYNLQTLTPEKNVNLSKNLQKNRIVNKSHIINSNQQNFKAHQQFYYNKNRQDNNSNKGTFIGFTMKNVLKVVQSQPHNNHFFNRQPRRLTFDKRKENHTLDASIHIPQHQIILKPKLQSQNKQILRGSLNSYYNQENIKLKRSLTFNQNQPIIKPSSLTNIQLTSTLNGFKYQDSIKQEPKSISIHKEFERNKRFIQLVPKSLNKKPSNITIRQNNVSFIQSQRPGTRHQIVINSLIYNESPKKHNKLLENTTHLGQYFPYSKAKNNYHEQRIRTIIQNPFSVISNRSFK